MNINGIEVELNMMDADTFDRYMDAAYKVDAAMNETITEEEAKDYKNVSNIIRRKCQAVKDFCDTLFGSGKGVQMCGEGNDFKKCYGVYTSIVDDVKSQGKEASVMFMAVHQKSSVS